MTQLLSWSSSSSSPARRLLHAAARLRRVKLLLFDAAGPHALLRLECAELVVLERDPVARLDVGEVVPDALGDLAPRLIRGVGAAAGHVAHLELGGDGRGAPDQGECKGPDDDQADNASHGSLLRRVR